MKKLSKILFLVAFAATSQISSGKGVVNQAYAVANWPNGCTAAISYTFDDNCPLQNTVAVPMFNSYNFDATFFVVSGWISNWTPWQNAKSAGHEIASHTVTHARLQSAPESEYSASQAAINANISGNQCLTIAYPNCRSGNQATCAKYYISGRNCSGGVNPATPSNLYEIKANICGNRGTIKTLNDFISQNQAAAAAGGWQVYLLHDLDNGSGYSPLPSSVLNDSLAWLDARRSTYWVTTYLNVVNYIKQRSSVAVTELSADANTFTVSVTDDLDNAVYNQRLNIHRVLPASWTGATVKQNNVSIPSSIINKGSAKFVQFDALPDGGDVVITSN